MMLSPRDASQEPGRFGEHMLVMLVNDGPVTFLVQSRLHRWADSGRVFDKSHFIYPEAVSIVRRGPYH